MAQRKAEDWGRIALVAGGVVVAFLVGRKVLQFFNIVPTAEEAEQERQRRSALAQAQRQTTVKQSQPDFYWQNLANTIHEAWKYSRFDDDKDLAEAKLKEPRNDADFLKLVQFYGKRQNYFFGIPEGGLRTLSEAANSELAEDRINRINSNYAQKGIKFRL